MALFRKRQEEEIDERERERDLPRRRKFKDLRPENKKNRKEPAKSWGRKERFLIGGVLLATLAISGALAVMARDWKLPGFPRIVLPRLTGISFQKTIVLEGNRKAPDFTKVKDDFVGETKNLSGVYGVYVYELDSDNSYGVNESEVYTAASLIKLPVFIALYQEAEEGSVNLDTKYTLKQADQVGGSGSLQSRIGSTYTYRELAGYMGRESDNTAYKVLKDIIGDEKINQVIAEIGMKKTSLEENETTPKDVGTLFKKLWNGELVETQSRDEILKFLTDTIYEDHLVKGIPEGIRVAHKYGREIHVVNDGGIVLTDKPYIVVIMSKGIVEKDADLVFPILSKIVFGFEESF